ncbi:MAG: XTP/dITP diphosphatase [Candidatus Bathyarchaeota archaeon]|nr:XTP/dITP diphosphatase [Candidatus Bathyarchaeota archaeon]
MTKSKIWFATGNAHKVSEAATVLAPYGIALEHYPLERVEIQADDPADIAAYSLSMVKDPRPLCVEDAGVSITRWGDFPGPYSSYVLERLGNPGILKLMQGEQNRRAHYVSAIAYRDESGVHTFRGTVDGEVAQSIRGTNGFGYDPIFIPAEGDGRTFGEMEPEEKNKISHRARAFRALAEWLTKS